MNVAGEAHSAGLEDARVHHAQVGRDARPKSHSCDDVAFRIEPRRDLDQLEAVAADAKHRALGDEQCDLTFRATDVGAVADLLELRHELAMASLLPDHGASA